MFRDETKEKLFLDAMKAEYPDLTVKIPFYPGTRVGYGGYEVVFDPKEIGLEPEQKLKEGNPELYWFVYNLYDKIFMTDIKAEIFGALVDTFYGKKSADPIDFNSITSKI